jgi:hypothetical protein
MPECGPGSAYQQPKRAEDLEIARDFSGVSCVAGDAPFSAPPGVAPSVALRSLASSSTMRVPSTRGRKRRVIGSS